MMTTEQTRIDSAMIGNYFYALVNRFYKILPIKESGEPTLSKYIDSLLREMLGFGELMQAIGQDERYFTLMIILQYFSNHIDEMDSPTVKMEVFRAINIIKTLRRQYGKEA